MSQSNQTLNQERPHLHFCSAAHLYMPDLIIGPSPGFALWTLPAGPGSCFWPLSPGGTLILPQASWLQARTLPRTWPAGPLAFLGRLWKESRLSMYSGTLYLGPGFSIQLLKYFFRIPGKSFIFLLPSSLLRPKKIIHAIIYTIQQIFSEQSKWPSAVSHVWTIHTNRT